MARDTRRRAALADAATDYVLEHGLIGLSLRPLAAALGTSDRMLLYHFGSKDDLIAAVLLTSNDRSVAVLRALPAAPDVRTAVTDLWRAATSAPLDRCQRMYVEAAALGLLGREPYVSLVREANELWVTALADHLVASGAHPDRARRAAHLFDAGHMGLQLDLPLAPAEAGTHGTVGDLAEAVAAVAGQGSA